MSFSKQTLAFVYAGLTVLAWSTVSTAFKVALDSLTPMQLIYASMGTATLFLLAALAAKKELATLSRLSAWQWLKGAGLGLMLYCYYAVLFLAYERLPAQIAQPINNTWALVLALAGSWIMKQKLSAIEFFWMLFAYAGVVVLSAGSGSTLGPLNPFGLACIIASTGLYAFYWIANARSGVPERECLLICFASAFLLSAFTLIVQGESLRFALRPFLGGVYVGLFELAIPFMLWGMALRLTTSVARISSMPFLVPFLALFWISMVLGEPIAPTTIAGLIIIVLGTFMQQRVAARKKR